MHAGIGEFACIDVDTFTDGIFLLVNFQVVTVVAIPVTNEYFGP